MTYPAKRPNLYIIAAMSENRVIGIKNHLPWHLPDEWKYFRKVTHGKAFLMGRKSFEAPDALHSTYRNVVLSSSDARPAPLIEYAKKLEDALTLLENETEVFILGGASVFEQTLPLASKLFLTVVHTNLEGDAHFPGVSAQEWELISSDYHESDDDHAFAFSMNQYIRKAGNSS